MLSDSSKVTRSAGSTMGSLDCPLTQSVPPGTGSGIQSPTYRSRLARAEPSRSRQMRLATFDSQAPGVSISRRCSSDRAYQRAYVSCTTSSASATDPSSR